MTNPRRCVPKFMTSPLGRVPTQVCAFRTITEPSRLGTTPIADQPTIVRKRPKFKIVKPSVLTPVGSWAYAIPGANYAECRP